MLLKGRSRRCAIDNFILKLYDKEEFIVFLIIFFSGGAVIVEGAEVKIRTGGEIISDWKLR